MAARDRTPRFAGLVLAAGEARRFGSPKQLARYDGAPLLEHALRAMRAVPELRRVVVTLGAAAEQILRAVDLHGAEPVIVDAWREGQSASLRAGVRALAADADAIVVTLGDQPHVSAASIARVLAAWDEQVDAVRASFEGTPGHPVLLARSLYDAVEELRGDVGARALLDERASVRLVDCGAEAVLDVDTPESLAIDARSEPSGR
ncbi:MAG: nucleotidyltransferase family protein [Conexibacter sp.]